MAPNGLNSTFAGKIQCYGIPDFKYYLQRKRGRNF